MTMSMFESLDTHELAKGCDGAKPIFYDRLTLDQIAEVEAVVYAHHTPANGYISAKSKYRDQGLTDEWGKWIRHIKQADRKTGSIQ